MKIKEYEIPEKMLYSKEHEWAKELGSGRVLVGITDYAVKMLGDIVYVQLPEVGADVRFMEPFGTVESIKAVSDIYSPVTGKIIKTNAELREHPEKVANSPYDAGWLVEVQASDFKGDVGKLMKPGEYASYIGELSEED